MAGKCVAQNPTRRFTRWTSLNFSRTALVSMTPLKGWARRAPRGALRRAGIVCGGMGAAAPICIMIFGTIPDRVPFVSLIREYNHQKVNDNPGSYQQ